MILIRQIKRWELQPIVVMATIIGFILCGTISAFKAYQSAELIRMLPNTSVWGLVQLQEEHRRFINTLKLYQYKGVSKQQLLFRYNILWSRFPILLKGNDAADLNSISGGKALVRDMFAEIQRIEPMLDGLPQTTIDLPKVLHWLESFSAPVNVLVNREFHRKQDLRAQLKQQLRAQQRILNASLLGLALSFLLLLAVFYRQTNRFVWLKNHDSLTGLANREALEQLLQQRLDEQMRVDLFGMVFPSLAAVMGKLTMSQSRQLTEQIALELKRLQSDDILTIARLGENQFVVVSNSLVSVQEMIERLQQIQTSFTIAGHLYQLPLQIAIVTGQDQCYQSNQLLAYLAQAFLQSQQRNERVHYFRRDKAREQLRWQQLADDFPQALQARKLELLYQPVMRFNRDIPEALQLRLRWVHPELGRVEHQSIIALAEHTDLRERLSLWFFEQTIEQHCQWLQRYDQRLLLLLPFPQCWLDDAVIGQLNMQLLKSKLAMSQLLVAVHDTGKVMVAHSHHQLKMLRQQGFQIVIDDVLEYAMNWQKLLWSRFDFIKLTAPLCADLTHPQHQYQLEALAQFISHLKRQIIFEGVSNRDQLQLIKAVMPQAFVCGAVFAPYMNVAQTEKYLQEQST
ncbi:EAL domain-containing protein [Celerinatantimonas yamalensis]|uniref:EAL domain-containing protein n=1 Tax=Celerinatantimonas yamalensis TaxID=559956 RepID=A0ABW9G647_9GAMM